VQLLVVTGYSRGIGQSLVWELQTRRLAGKLAAIFLFVGRSDPDAALLAEGDLFVRWDLGMECDQALHDQIVMALRALPSNVQHWGLFYAAGALGPIGVAAKHTDVSKAKNPGREWAEWRQANSQCLFINATNFVSLCQILIAERGVGSSGNFVLHLSSGAALHPYGDLEAYSASKAAALMHARCLAMRHAPEQLAVLSIAPGTVRTAMTATLAATEPARFPDLQKFRDLRDQGAFAEPTLVGSQLVSIALDADQKELRHRIHGKYYDLRKPDDII
jgi:NAD(P)-dependent dehydrogenase (short-subunit alcohol dehydrogenase family)